MRAQLEETSISPARTCSSLAAGGDLHWDMDKHKLPSSLIFNHEMNNNPS